MLFFKNKNSWAISENHVTDEEKFLNRRFFLKTLGSFSIAPLMISSPSYQVFAGQGYNLSSKINKNY